MVLILYEWKLSSLTNFRGFIVLMSLLEYYLVIKIPLLLLSWLGWLARLIGTSQKIVAFILETWLYVRSPNFIV